MDKAMGVHNKLVLKLEDRLKRSRINYQNIEHNVNYELGEIDLFAIHNGYMLLFEMKSHYAPKQHSKAKKQLAREEKYFKRYANRIFKFEVNYTNHSNTDYRIKRIR